MSNKEMSMEKLRGNYVKKKFQCSEENKKAKNIRYKSTNIFIGSLLRLTIT